MSRTVRIIQVLLLLLTIVYADDTALKEEASITAYSLFAKGDWPKALTRFAENVRNGQTDSLFYLAECYYQNGNLTEAERLLKKTVETPFNKQEAYWRLSEIARQRNDSKAMELYTNEVGRIGQKAWDSFVAIEGFKPDPKDTQKETQMKTYLYYSPRHGFPGETSGDALLSIGRFSDAIKAYEYAVEQNVPIVERLSSPLGRKLYNKLALVYKHYAETLKMQNKSEAEVSQASSMAQYYGNKSLAVQSLQKAE